MQPVGDGFAFSLDEEVEQNQHERHEEREFLHVDHEQHEVGSNDNRRGCPPLLPQIVHQQERVETAEQPALDVGPDARSSLRVLLAQLIHQVRLGKDVDEVHRSDARGNQHDRENQRGQLHPLEWYLRPDDEVFEDGVLLADAEVENEEHTKYDAIAGHAEAVEVPHGEQGMYKRDVNEDVEEDGEERRHVAYAPIEQHRHHRQHGPCHEAARAHVDVVDVHVAE